MSSLPPPRAIYVLGGREPVLGLMHAPEPARERDTAVLLCPPFGWDDVCSYRSRRDWAEQLAGAGYPTLRLDLPGTGDSGGSLEDPDLLSKWVEAVRCAARLLPEICGATRVASIGIGMGGLVSCVAVAQGAPIEELVLWAVPARGSALVRELRAFGRLERAKYEGGRDSVPQSLPEGAVGAGGFVLAKETTEALARLDLTTMAALDGRPRRALLLGRDGIAPDQRLYEHLEAIGAEVQVAPGEGYGEMMAEPQEARPPSEVFASVERWLGEGSAPRSGVARSENGHVQAGRQSGRTATSARLLAPATAEMMVGGVRIRETALSIQQPWGRLFGVLAEPLHGGDHELGAVLLNAGAIRRIGPNRMWVRLARGWAARGVPTLRLDLEGLGDADGDASRFTDVGELYIPELVAQVRAALDELVARGVANRFVLAGLCSGAYWSFHGALEDERVAAAFMLNPRTLFWDSAVETIRYLRRGMLEPDSWRMILRGDVQLSRVGTVARQAPRSLARRAVAHWREHDTGDEQLETALDRLASTGKHLVFVFSGNEPLHQELGRRGQLRGLERRPNVELELLPGTDHTLRPARSQQRAYEVLDRALSRELDLISR